jgi:quercetin dioxygenase-like cupin family protein
MKAMTTVSEVLNVLKERGYTVDFNLNDNCLICQQNSLQIYPNEFVVDKHYRFEGMSDPADEAIVYAISSDKHNLKGTLINGYGIYADKLADEMIQALRENPNPVQFANTDEEEDAEPEYAKIKYNQATPLRPEGDRLLDAQMVIMDLTEYREKIKDEKTWKEGDRTAITLFKSDIMRVVLIALHAGSEMKTHTAPGIISVQVLSGRINFRTEQRTAELGEGQMLTLHAGIPHSVLAYEESAFLLTMSIKPERD